MIEIRPRATVILTADFTQLVYWYRDILGLAIMSLNSDDYHFCNLETHSGIKIDIVDARKMNFTPRDRQNDTVVLQFAADEVTAFLLNLKQHGATITVGQ